MSRYVGKRIISIFPLLLLVTFCAFFLINIRTSDPAEIALRINGVVPTEEMVQSTRTELGLDSPFLIRYKDWLVNSFQGEFGTSYVSRKPVKDEILQALPPTLKLAGVTLLIIIISSICLGALCSVYENRWPDRIIRIIVFIFSAMPSFWIGPLLILLFSVYLGWFPTSGMGSSRSVVLPAVTLSLTFLSTYVRLIRNNMIHNKKANFILYAKVRGLPKSLITKQLFVNSIHSSLTAFGMSIPKLIAGTIVIENIFAWPGIGRLCVTAIFNSDSPVIQAYIFILAILFIVCNLIVDIVAMLMDPRLRRRAV